MITSTDSNADIDETLWLNETLWARTSVHYEIIDWADRILKFLWASKYTSDVSPFDIECIEIHIKLHDSFLKEKESIVSSLFQEIKYSGPDCSNSLARIDDNSFQIKISIKHNRFNFFISTDIFIYFIDEEI